jgi:hypothetical protein
MKTILLSHHPSCKKFDKHTIKIGKYKFCIGCFIGYPTAIIGILAFYFLNLSDIFDSTFFFTVGMIFISFFILSPLNLTKIKIIKIFQKFLIGIGSVFLYFWIWSLQNLFIVNFIYFIMVFGLLLTLLNAYHAYGFYKICKNCENSLDWENCPGFQELSKCFKEHNLTNIFKTPQKK